MLNGIIAGLVVSNTGGGGSPLTATGVSDFKNGVYEIAGVSVAVGGFWYVGTSWWGTFDPSVSVTAGVGLICSGVGSKDAASMSTGDASYTAINPGNLGFVAVFDIVYPAYPPDQGSMQFTWLEASFAHESYFYTDHYFSDHTGYINLTDPSNSDFADTFALTRWPGGTSQRFAARFAQDHTTIQLPGQSSVSASGSTCTDMTLMGFSNYDPSNSPIKVEKLTFYPLSTDLDTAIAVTP